jgi:hypothetical protein
MIPFKSRKEKSCPEEMEQDRPREELVGDEEPEEAVEVEWEASLAPVRRAFAYAPVAVIKYCIGVDSLATRCPVPNAVR